MIVNINRKDMLNLARKVARASPTGPSTDTHKGILLEANDRAGIVVMTATNLQVSIRGVMPASIEAGGRVVIPTGLLMGMLEKLPGETVYIEARDSNNLYAASGRAWYQLAALPGDHYPQVHIPLPDDSVMVTGLKSLVANARIAVPKTMSESNPVFNCIALSFSKDGLRASSGGPMGVVQVCGDREAVGESSMLVPANALRMLTAICHDSDVFSVGITGPGTNGRQVVFHDGTLTFASRLVEGKHLDMDALFTGFTPAAKVVVAAETLKAALEGVTTVADSGGTVEIGFTEGGLTLRCDAAFGGSTSTVGAAIDTPLQSPVYLHGGRLTECVRALSGDMVMLFSKEGHMLIQTDQLRYLQPASRPGKTTHSQSPRKKKAA